MLFVIITAALAGILSVESTENTRCFKGKLDFSGLRRGRENWYEDGHLFQIACEAGYQINDEAEVKCSEGEWTANVPPCTTVDCAEPPTIPYANLEKTSTTHGSYAIYAFQDPYKLIGHVRVQCLFGEWISIPRCNDGSCDLNNITHSNEISREETPHYANSGQRLRVICKAGYSPARFGRPYCSAGKWRRNFESPCKKDDCLVPEVKHGYIFEKVYGGRYWHIWKGYVDDIKEETVPYGTLVKPNATYYLHCDSGYSYQGSSETEKSITCIESYWDPEPVCIPRTSGAAKLKNDVTTPVPQEVTCEKPLPPERGSVQFSDGQAVGSLATYLCEEGTTLVGVSLSKCLETGNWTFDPPKCLRSCIIPEIENGVNGFPKKVRRYPRIYEEFVQFQVGETAKHGVSVILRCLNGSIPVNITTLRNGDTDDVSCLDGVWSKSMQCAPSKCLEDPPHMENSYPLVEKNTNGSVIWYKCERGFENVKAGYAECVYGTWKKYPSVCGEISMCSIENLLLSLPANVLPDLRNLTGDYVPYGTEIQFLCDSNSFVSGSQKAKCGRGGGGGWEFGVVRCIQRCVLEKISPQLLVEPIKEYYLFGEPVTFSCPRGQKLSSEVRRVMCLGTSWSDPIPDCVEAIYWGK